MGERTTIALSKDMKKALTEIGINHFRKNKLQNMPTIPQIVGMLITHWHDPTIFEDEEKIIEKHSVEYLRGMKDVRDAKLHEKKCMGCDNIVLVDSKNYTPRCVECNPDGGLSIKTTARLKEMQANDRELEDLEDD